MVTFVVSQEKTVYYPYSILLKHMTEPSSICKTKSPEVVDDR